VPAARYVPILYPDQKYGCLLQDMFQYFTLIRNTGAGISPGCILLKLNKKARVINPGFNYQYYYIYRI